MAEQHSRKHFTETVPTGIVLDVVLLSTPRELHACPPDSQCDVRMASNFPEDYSVRPKHSGLLSKNSFE